MANGFITPRQLVQRMIDNAATVVKDMPVEKVRKLAHSKGACFGFCGALGVSLILAAKNRLAELEGSESCL